MQRYEVTYFQMIMIGLGVGFVLGLIPLGLGWYKGKKKLAIIGFLASIAAGAAWSLFSLIIVLVFIWLILRNPQTATAETADPFGDEAAMSAEVEATSDDNAQN